MSESKFNHDGLYALTSDDRLTTNEGNTANNNSGAEGATERTRVSDSNTDDYKVDESVASGSKSARQENEQRNHTEEGAEQKDQQKQGGETAWIETIIVAKDAKDAWDLAELSNEILSKANYMLDRFPTYDEQNHNPEFFLCVHEFKRMYDTMKNRWGDEHMPDQIQNIAAMYQQLTTHWATMSQEEKSRWNYDT